MSLPDRRQLLRAAVSAAVAATIPGCGSAEPSFSGRLLGPRMDLGHQIRDGKLPATPAESHSKASVVIVGAGIAGLTAAWRLIQQGVNDFQILEVESVAGGTSRSDKTEVTAYPWGAHYVPVPRQGFEPLWELFLEMQLADKVDGRFVVRENFLCRDPQERVFADGLWREGLFPRQVATDSDRQQWERFKDLVNDWVDWRDPSGRPAFTLPLAECSDAPEVLALDQLTMAEWLNHNKLNSAPLRWYVDYSCRDDFGLTISQTSAWAGLLYFCSRRTSSSDAPPEVLTWPEGNGRLVSWFRDRSAKQLRTNTAVARVHQRPNGGVDLTLISEDSEAPELLSAQKVILATPQFLAPYLIQEFPIQRQAASRRFTYGAWVVANIHLKSRPLESQFPMSWDNVIYDSPSLGYVAATHQLGADYGPTVLSWYLPLCEALPPESRQQLLEFDWKHWSSLITNDLANAHPDLIPLISQLDVFRWGHAMIRPVPGFHSSEERLAAARPAGDIHFAGTDLSGVALFEEAFWHGRRAADEVIAALNTGD